MSIIAETESKNIRTRKKGDIKTKDSASQGKATGPKGKPIIEKAARTAAVDQIHRSIKTRRDEDGKAPNDEQRTAAPVEKVERAASVTSAQTVAAIQKAKRTTAAKRIWTEKQTRAAEQAAALPEAAPIIAPATPPAATNSAAPSDAIQQAQRMAAAKKLWKEKQTRAAEQEAASREAATTAPISSPAPGGTYTSPTGTAPTAPGGSPTGPAGGAAPASVTGQPGQTTASLPAIRERGTSGTAPAIKEKPRLGPAAIKTRPEPRRAVFSSRPSPTVQEMGKRAAITSAKKRQRRAQEAGRQLLVQQAKKAARAAAVTSRKIVEASAKATKALISALVALLGGSVFIAVVCLIFLVAAIVSSPFGILFTDEPEAPDAVWQADGESEKTSIRTSNSMGILTEQGCFTGGSLAYGYKYVKSGRTNKRKQEVRDLAICEEEAYIVRLMFQLASEEGYGAQKLANYLNAKGFKNRSGNNWHPATIQSMLRNILYTGILRSGKSRSPVQEQLRIVDDRTFERVQNMLKERSYKYKETRSAPLNTRGHSLLAGNIFCGHCGARLCITTTGRYRRTGDGPDTARMRYSCQTKTRKHEQCDGQTGYTVKKLDEYIDIIIRGVFRQLEKIGREDIRAALQNDDHNDREAFCAKAKHDLEKAESDMQKLQGEIVKSIVGESAFAPEMLSAAIREQEKKCIELRAAYSEARTELEKCLTEQNEFEQQYDELLGWADEYSSADIPAKRMIISYMVDRVDVYRDYRLKITFKIRIDRLLKSLRALERSRRSIDRSRETVYNEAS